MASVQLPEGEQLPAGLSIQVAESKPDEHTHMVVPVGSGAMQLTWHDSIRSAGAAAFAALGVLGQYLVQYVVPALHNSSFEGLLLAGATAYFGSLLIRWVNNNSHEAIILPQNTLMSFRPTGAPAPYTPAPYTPGAPGPVPYTPASPPQPDATRPPPPPPSMFQH